MGDVTNIDQAFHWNITRIGEALNLHRSTVRQRLRRAGVTPAGERNGVPVYRLSEAVRAVYKEQPAAETPSGMLPADHLAHWRALREQAAVERELAGLVDEKAARKERAVLAASVLPVLGRLPERLEREASLSPAALAVVGERVATLQDMLAAIVEDCADARPSDAR